MLQAKSSLILRLGTVAGLFVCATVPAHAGGVSVGVHVGVPIVSAYGPVGAVNVHYGGGRGHYRGGGYRGGYYGPGWGWGLGLGLGLGAVLSAPYVIEQPITVIQQPSAPPPVVLPPSRPEPVVYPRNGQGAQQAEADRQECNRWATSQPAALADSSVFMRAVEACMDARGYTLK